MGVGRGWFCTHLFTCNKLPGQIKTESDLSFSKEQRTYIANIKLSEIDSTQNVLVVSHQLRIRISNLG